MSFLTPFTFYLNFAVKLHLRCYSFDKAHFLSMDTPIACDEKRKQLLEIK